VGLLSGTRAICSLPIVWTSSEPYVGNPDKYEKIVRFEKGKKMRTIVIIMSLFLMLAGLGCAALSEFVTPAGIDRNAVRYVDSSGVADANDYRGYPNLLKAGRLKKDVDAAHDTIQLDLAQQVQKDNLEYGIHTDTTSRNLVVAQQREETLFGETGLLSLGMSMAGIGTLTGFLGLMRKRPGDVTTVEMEQALAQATGKSVEDLSVKQRQFTQVIQGIEKFTDSITSDEWNRFKDVMNQAQDTDTQIAVQSIKKELNL